jgi:hypothetical protein
MLTTFLIAVKSNEFSVGNTMCTLSPSCFDIESNRNSSSDKCCPKSVLVAGCVAYSKI